MHSPVPPPSTSRHSEVSSDTSPPLHSRCQTSLIISASRKVLHHFKKHVGVGIICAVGYFDPGNWSVDIQAGASFGYRPMLFVIFLAGIMAIILQVLAARLGCVTGLAYLLKIWLIIVGYFFTIIISTPAIISTDLAELLGSAIGLTLLFPKLPLWSAVLLTGVDVFIFLIIGDPSQTGRPVRLFEIVIILLVAIVFICFIVLLVRVNPDWQHVFLGFVPSDGLLQTQPNAVYTAIGIVGATVMPHALFLGSNLATQDRVSQPPQPFPPPVDIRRPSFLQRLQQVWTNLFYFSRSRREDFKDYTTRHEFRTNNSIEFIRSHIWHGTVDVILSLVGLAVPINSAILILSGTMFYASGNVSSIGLYNMHDLMLQNLGKGAAFLFALALVCAGQTASVTATLSGQIVSEGFISWNISPFIRRLLTRLISLIPSMIVAISSGGSGINTLLIASQVVLSVVLPFVAFPLIYLTSSKLVMAVKTPKPMQEKLANGSPIPSYPISDTLSMHEQSIPVTTCVTVVERKLECDHDPINHPQEYDIIDFSNGYLLTTFAYAIWMVILVANIYAITMIGMGETGQ